MWKVVQNDTMNRKELRVLLHLLTHLDSKAYKSISKKTIAYDLGMDKKDVGECLERLADLGLIESGSSNSVKKGYMLLF